MLLRHHVLSTIKEGLAVRQNVTLCSLRLLLSDSIAAVQACILCTVRVSVLTLVCSWSIVCTRLLSVAIVSD